MRALCREALSIGARLIVPAGVVAQVFRDRTRQVALRALINSSASQVVALDQVLAESAGILCGQSGTADIVDASVVLVARRAHAKVITSDVRGLRRLDPALELEKI